MKTIFCFGDSITYGEKDLEQGGWVERLKRDFLELESGDDYQKTMVYNLGIASETTDGLVGRVENELKARRIGKAESTTILFYGYNDIKIHKQKNRVPLKYFSRNLRQSINLIRQTQREVILMTLPSITESIDGVIDCCGNLRYEKDLVEYNLLIQSLARELECELIDLNVVFKQLELNFLATDQLHFNAIGHQVIFEQVKEKLN